MAITYLSLDKSQLSLADARSDCKLLPIISRNTLVKNSTSLELIWQTFRQHFGFQATGAKVIDFSDIHLAEDERPEDLYERLVAFVEDSLLHARGLTHYGEHVPEDEELTPTLANFVVLTWLRLTHSQQLPLSSTRLAMSTLRILVLKMLRLGSSRIPFSNLDQIYGP